jgi:uncharacterized protein (DUF305 family)
MRIKPYTMVTSAAALLTLALTACGGNSTSSAASAPSAPAKKPLHSSPAGTDHSAQDLAFTQWMTAHHQQAVQAADIAKTRGALSDVKALAGDIAKGQQGEINTMTGWLQKWDAKVPTAGTPMQNLEGGPKTATAMMSDKQLSDLKTKSGKAFDTSYLHIMLEHIQSAIGSAKTEEQQGSFPAAKQLAAGIVKDQTAGATRIHKMLAARA